MLRDNFSLDGASILITGGTGSFGQRFVRTVIEHYNPEQLIVFSRDEWKQSEMAEQHPRSSFPALRFVLGDVRDRERLESVLRGVHLVVHAAALKQVPGGEANPYEFVQTNVVGAEHVAQAAVRAGVSRVIALSTDKAVLPVSMYGASKLAADKILLAANWLTSSSETRFSVVRYGNVLVSRGSVIPFFLKLISQGAKQLPITHSCMTRFWITLQKSVEMVLSSAVSMNGGEIFVPRIPSMKVVDVARALAPHLPHEVVGMRPGEKLHETLITEEEASRTVELEDRFIIFDSVQDARCQARDGDSLVSSGFRYASNDEQQRLDHAGLLQMLAEDGVEVKVHV